ncbi:MAG TPA: FAD-dependent oxidoreductase [Actinomycetota bacterium]|nr:FAD-dependent oxidoreductase [Actinomycetota bacterium]
MIDTDVAVIGAGPYGLSATAYLRAAGMRTLTLGDPMSFWRAMPAGMVLRSNWSASSIADYRGPLSLDAYCANTGDRFGRPIPLNRFIAYGEWVQRKVAADVDRRRVLQVDRRSDDFLLALSDGEPVTARRVVVAGGIAPFAWRPPSLGDLTADVASHTADHADLTPFADRKVLVVGGGQSALESAALIREAGGEVEVLVRQDRIHWLHGGKYHRMLGRCAPLVYAPTDVGPLGLSRLVAIPDLFRKLPRRVQDPLAHRCIRPAGAAWLVPRLADVPLTLGCTIRGATPGPGGLRVELSDGSTRNVDHLLFGTGYRVDVHRYPFLGPDIKRELKLVNGYPVLGMGLEASVPGLHFLGAPASWSFGPVMRFVSGSWYAGREVTQSIVRGNDHHGHVEALSRPGSLRVFAPEYDPDVPREARDEEEFAGG